MQETKIHSEQAKSIASFDYSRVEWGNEYLDELITSDNDKYLQQHERNFIKKGRALPASLFAQMFNELNDNESPTELIRTPAYSIQVLNLNDGE